MVEVEEGWRSRERGRKGEERWEGRWQASISDVTCFSSSSQQIAQSLQSMLEYDGDTTSFEETFMATFQVSYSDVFGTLHTHDLKEGGDSVSITKSNCQVSIIRSMHVVLSSEHQ